MRLKVEINTREHFTVEGYRISHSPAFWNELDKKMPEYREHENWLKHNGVKMAL
jgi:hypothetical protein